MASGRFLRGLLFPAALQLFPLANVCFGAFRKIPTALPKRSPSVLPGTGGAGCGFILCRSFSPESSAFQVLAVRDVRSFVVRWACWTPILRHPVTSIALVGLGGPLGG